jgi:hypothetical protein
MIQCADAANANVEVHVTRRDDVIADEDSPDSGSKASKGTVSQLMLML